MLLSRYSLSSFTLKVIAILGMTANHAAHLFELVLPFPVWCVLLGLGGLTFPIMAFLLAEGFRHTSNVRNYALRLAIFAFIAQIPYNLFLGSEGNVLFTLLLGLILLYLHKLPYFSDGSYFHKALWWLSVCLVILISSWCDWGLIGVIMILFAGLFQTRTQQALGCGLIPALVFGLPSLFQIGDGEISAIGTLLYACANGVAGLLLCLYKGERGRSMKWFFYAYYPAHIAVLGLINMVLFGAPFGLDTHFVL